MQDLEKVNEKQLIALGKNLTIGLVVLTVTMLLSKLLPFYFSPIVGLLAAAFVYTVLYNNKLRNSRSCMLVPYAVFYCLICYSFISIIINVLDIWNIIHIPRELSFFNQPYISTLLLDPICFMVMLFFHMRRSKLTICIDCKLHNGIALERGKLGEIYSTESHLQLVNFIWLFGILSLVTWGYYLAWYAHDDVLNNKDSYVFFWLNAIAFILDGFYFASRYYNIYLDLKENGEIITEEELGDMTTKTYLRFYVACGNHLFLNSRVADPTTPDRMVIDTPFLTKRNVNGITTAEVLGIIQQLTGVKGGELRFIYGRKAADLSKHRILRYIYFIDGTPEDNPMKISGEWMDYDFLKVIYNNQPSQLSRIFVSDISRVSTIILTQKIFDERGYRKIKTKSYQPTYSLQEIREKNYDFQDDKWIRISMFNSDNRGFYMKNWWKKFTSKNSSNQWR